VVQLIPRKEEKKEVYKHIRAIAVKEDSGMKEEKEQLLRKPSGKNTYLKNRRFVNLGKSTMPAERN